MVKICSSINKMCEHRQGSGQKDKESLVKATDIKIVLIQANITAKQKNKQLGGNVYLKTNTAQKAKLDLG